MSATRLRIVCWLALSAVWCGPLGVVRPIAAESAPADFGIQRIDVPEDQPESWPLRQHRWVPIARTDFEKYLQRKQQAASPPSTPTWRQAVYQATLSADILSEGHLTAELLQTTGHPRLLPLGQPSIAIEELSWDQTPASWGTDLTGKHWIHPPAQEHRLEGRWTASGRPLAGGVLFDLELLPAAISRLEIRVPRGYRITALDSGDVEELAPTAEESTVVWRVHLGQAVRCRLLCTAPPETGTSAATVLYEQKLSVVVGQNELRLQETLDKLEILNAPTDRLNLSLPRTVEIVSATYDEKPFETPLKWIQSPRDGPLSQVTILLPESMRGRLRPVRLEGVMRRAAGEQSLTLPQFHLEGGTWLSGGLAVTVLPPLEVRSYRPTGYRQDVPISSTKDGEVLSFQQVTPRAQISLNIDRPAPGRAARILNLLTSEQESWTLTAEMAWECRSGTVYDASCRLPDGLRVVSVAPLAGAEQVVWSVKPHAVSGQVLQLEFPNGLAVGRVEPISVVARQAIAGAALPDHVPLFIPLDCEHSEVVLTMPEALSERWRPEQWKSFEPFDPVRAVLANPVWNTLPAMSDLVRELGPNDKILRLVTQETAVPVAQSERQTFLAAEAEITANLHPQSVDEEFKIRIDPLPTTRLIELYFPRSGQGITWSTGTQMPVSATLSPTLQTTVQRPMPAGGEFWTIPIPESIEGTSLVLIGRRQTERADRYTVPLVFLPQSFQFRGRISLLSDRAAHDQLHVAAVDGFPLRTEREDPAGLVQELTPDKPVERTYQTWDREWSVRQQVRGPAEIPQATFALESMLTEESQGFDFHRLRLQLPEPDDQGELRFRLEAPGEMIAVLREGRRVPMAVAGSEFVVDERQTAKSEHFEILYRVPVERGFWGTRHRFLLPQLDWKCAGFTWSVSIPSETFLPPDAVGLPFTSPVPAPKWVQRLFGPLARTIEQQVFLPFPPQGGVAANPSIADSVVASFSSRLGIDSQESRIVLSAADVALPESQSFWCWSRDVLSLMNWLAFLASVAVGVLLRFREGSRQASWMAFLVSATAGLALFGPVPFNSILGSASTGLLLSWLVPRSAFAVWPIAPAAVLRSSGSTATYQGGLKPVLILLACGLSLRLGLAQDRAASSEAIRAPLERVLVPIGPDGRPSIDNPVVYVSPKLSDEIALSDQVVSTEPTQLIRAAEYVVHTDASARLSMKVRYQVDFLSENTTVVQVPVGRSWLASLENCSVNGRSQTAAIAPDGKSLSLSFDRETVPATSSEQPRRVEVVLDVRLPASAAAGREEFVLDTFPTLDSRLLWNSGDRLPKFEMSDVHGAVSVSLDRRMVEAHLGAIRQVRMIWSKNGQPAVARSRAEIQLSQLLTVRPTITHGAMRIVCRVREGEVDRMELQLPPNCALRELRGNNFLRTLSRQSPDGGTVAIVEFATPQRQDFVVESDLLYPGPTDDGIVEIPRIQIRCGEGTAATLSNSAVALSCEPEFKIQLLNPDDPTVLPIPLEKFVSDWGDTLPVQDPQLAFQIQDRTDKHQPAIRLVPLQSEPQLLSWREEIRLDERVLDWRLTAEVKPAAQATFWHTILLDRRLKIEKVSVLEQGVERLLRPPASVPSIDFSQNRVMLFLNRETSGVLQVQIHATLPMRPSTDVLLPSVRFEAAQSVPGTLTLYHEPGYRIELTGRQTPLNDDGAANAPAANGTTWKKSGVFKVMEGDSGLNARLEQDVGRSAVQSGIALEPVEKSWRLNGKLKLTPDEGTREIRVVFPRWLAESRIELMGGVQQLAETLEDGKRIIDIPCTADRQSLELEWSLTMPEPAESEWTLEIPSVPHATTADTWIELPQESGWTASTADVAADEMPHPEALEAPSLLPNMKDGRRFRLTQATARLLRTDRLSPDGTISVQLVDHHIRETADGGWHGQTDFYPSLSAETIEVIMPAACRITGILAGNRLLPPGEVQTDAERIRLPQAGRSHIISVLWSRSSSERAPLLLGRRDIPLPKCVQQRPPTTLLTIIPAEGQTVLKVTGGRAGNALDLAFDRLEKLWRRYQLRAPSDAELSALIWREYRRTAACLSSPANQKGMTTERRQRWEHITNFVNQLPAPTDAEIANSARGEFLPSEHPAWNSPASWRGEVTDASSPVACWMMQQQTSGWLAALGVAAVGIAFLPRAFAFLAGNWMQSQPLFAWFLLGLFWWLFLSPSIVGFAVMAWTAFRAVQQRRLQTAAVAP